MPMIEVDPQTFEEITRRRLNKRMSEGDVVRESLGLGSTEQGRDEEKAVWVSEGVHFPVGTHLEHRFRDGRVVEATIVEGGVEVRGTVFSGLSPAGRAVTKHQLNGWTFWFLRDADGRLVAADTLRRR